MVPDTSIDHAFCVVAYTFKGDDLTALWLQYEGQQHKEHDMNNEIANAAIQTLQDHGIQGVEEAEVFTPAGGGVGIRFAGVRGYFVWTRSNGWGMCDAWGCDLTKHVGGMVQAVQVCKDLDVSAEIVAETDRMMKVYQLARTMYDNGWAAPSKDKGDSEELINAYGDIYMEENEIYW
jgi:hypothetical protein